MFSSEQWLANSGSNFYNGVATQSLRFNSGSSNHLYWTPSTSSTSTRTFTVSTWVKLGNLKTGSDSFIWCGQNVSGTTNCDLNFKTSSGEYYFQIGANGQSVKNTSELRRDVSAWYHLVAVFDTTQGTDTNRIKLYVNGEQRSISGTFPSQNTDFDIGGSNKQMIGALNLGSAGRFFDGYIGEFNFVDGTALTPSSFGETKNGVWIPKKYNGSYGTNGFRLKFDQVGVGTASTSTIGADTSGNTNHYTSGGIVASDCAMPDSPENNFATLNALDTRFRAELANGSLHLKALNYSSGNWGHSICTFKIPSSGKWYIEYYGLTLAGSNQTTAIGIMDSNIVAQTSTANYAITTDEGFDGVRHQHASSAVMKIYVDGAQSGSDISFSNPSAISALAIDVDNGYIYVGGNDGTGGTGSEITWRDYADGSTGSSNVDPTSDSSGTGGIARTFTNNDVIVTQVAVSGDSANKSQIYLNAGQDSSFAGNLTAQGNTDGNGIGDFYYAPPSGYLALCTANLPEPTIGANSDTQADDYFNTILWTGNGADDRSISGVGFQPDFVWLKQRNGTNYHTIFDSTRGATKAVYPNDTEAEATNADTLQAFESDGFEVGTSGGVNGNTNTFVAWNWKANGGTTSSNTDGSITSTVQANTDAGFSIVTYTGTGANATFGHGLGAVPKMIITKTRSHTGDWMVYHGANTSAPQTDFLKLNATNATEDLNTVWNDTAPTSSVFTLGSNGDVNTSGRTQVAYCFAEVEGYSKFGSFTGNGSADGTFVYTGFRPAFIIVKTTTVANWEMFDTTRSPSNVIGIRLFPSTTNAENAGEANCYDILSNGFKSRGAYGGNNISGEVHIYMAFAEAPFKYANAR